jgi:hypothetical protein
MISGMTCTGAVAAGTLPATSIAALATAMRTGCDRSAAASRSAGNTSATNLSFPMRSKYPGAFFAAPARTSPSGSCTTQRDTHKICRARTADTRRALP